MFRAVYRRIARFLNWVNRSAGPGPSASRITREIADERRDLQFRSGTGGPGGDFGP
jgi:hypothetical protein